MDSFTFMIYNILIICVIAFIVINFYYKGRLSEDGVILLLLVLFVEFIAVLVTVYPIHIPFIEIQLTFFDIILLNTYLLILILIYAASRINELKKRSIILAQEYALLSHLIGDEKIKNKLDTLFDE